MFLSVRHWSQGQTINSLRTITYGGSHQPRTSSTTTGARLGHSPLLPPQTCKLSDLYLYRQPRKPYRHSMTSCHGPVFLNTPWLPGFRHHFPLRINQRKLDRTWPNLHTVIHILSAIQLSQPCRPHHISDFSIGNHITFPIEKLSIHRKYVSLLMYTLYIKNVIGLQFSSVTQPCPSLCDLMDCSTPGFPVHHQLPEFVQTHVH